MSRIDIHHAHAQPDDAARKVIEDMTASLKQKFGVKADWVDNALKFSGSGVEGLIELLPGKVHVAAELGFPVSMMKSLVEGEIRRVLQEKLA
ncbi:polyhydroxyalkanoic acid system family protein [Stenotrophomonas sp. AB1(2024)]|jgi:putative polyhydroxyalkanoate system protein|uniref:polyhydroxyalkanoic acid system family protein n=1 Tax=Stenotrophomonas sp. AB1(2024) TaxID=3132215 RepID=UPI003096A609